MKRSAFSLVELSIVLVILGLLVGGILAGQSLIRASELRAVSSEHSKYQTALYAFRDKYFALPGDFAKAETFWGSSTACSGASATGTCNGNGDGTVGWAGAAGANGEMFQYWRQLALAGLVEGTYSGVAGPTDGTHCVAGTNAPASKLGGGALWCIVPLGHQTGDSSTYDFDYGHGMMFGYSAGGLPIGPVLKPEEAWNIDVKIDEGSPARGKLMARDSGGFGNTDACTTSASKTDYAGLYKVSTKLVVCELIFPKFF